MSASFIAACSGKQKFDTRAEASRHKALLNKKRPRIEYAPVEVYHCKHCGFFHYGSPRSGRSLRNRLERRRMKWETVGV